MRDFAENVVTPMLPGSDLIGMGLDLKRGIDLSSSTRFFVRSPREPSASGESRMTYASFGAIVYH
jgi:hypothetical protein